MIQIRPLSLLFILAFDNHQNREIYGWDPENQVSADNGKIPVA